MKQREMTRVGTTTGLAPNSSKEEARAEQVYVQLDTARSTHPIQIEAWAGYSIPATMRLTKLQAAELAGLLAIAVAKR
jgi:hypothetical protein